MFFRPLGKNAEQMLKMLKNASSIQEEYAPGMLGMSCIALAWGQSAYTTINNNNNHNKQQQQQQ